MQYEVIVKDGLEGVADKQNNIIIPCKYEVIFLDSFEKTELIEVKDKNYLSGIINIKDEIIIPCIYKQIILCYFKESNNSILYVNKNNLYGIINIKNEIIIPFKYINIIIYNNIFKCFFNNNEYTYYFIKNNKFLLYNKDKIYAI